MKRLEATFELAPCPVVDGDPLRFRLEVFSAAGRYTVTLHRWESIRVAPSFGAGAEQFDIDVLVRDEAAIVDDIVAASVEEALAAAQQRLDAQLDRR
jgi:hypothetical protein